MTQPMSYLKDNYERHFYYLRLSITDVCNFSCGYCLPNGYQKTDKHFLTLDEIRRIVTAFAELGVRKIRLTGGEPTLRSDFSDIAKTISTIHGIKKLALTTNGYKLLEHIEEYKHSGIQMITVSVDSLIPEKFYQITGHNRLPDVLAGINEAVRLNFKRVKINTVLLNHINIDEIESFIAWTRNIPISIRYIELMQTGTNLTYFKKHHIRSDVLRNHLEKIGWKQVTVREIDAGPAIEYFHPDYQGSIGIIAPYGKNFCATCNRLRVSARGQLHLCLFGDIGYSLRHLLQSDEQLPELKNFILEKLPYKRESHYLHENNHGINSNFAAIGG